MTAITGHRTGRRSTHHGRKPEPGTGGVRPRGGDPPRRSRAWSRGAPGPAGPLPRVPVCAGPGTAAGIRGRRRENRRRTPLYALAVLVVLILGATAAFAVRWGWGDGGASGRQAVAATACTPVDVVTAASFAPVLRAVAGPVREGKDSPTCA